MDQSDAPTSSEPTTVESCGPDAGAPAAGSPAPPPARDDLHPAAHGGGWGGLVLGALGIVFGDIGTSPLYAVQTVFSIDDGAVKPTVDDVYGVVSLIFWAVTVVVTIKYVTLVLRADNDGEGGIMALAALVQRVSRPFARRAAVALALGVVGASLFYGDSLITPAISVLSAVEGLEIARPQLAELVLPVGLGILTLLFVVQRWGTHRVGRLFGPVMVLWFLTLAVLGVPHIVAHPGVLLGLSPTYAVAFIVDHPFTAFLAMGAVVLAITGAEALYADMGHFGRRPIRVAWFVLVFPALILNYLGQTALIVEDPSAARSPFYLLAPGWAQLPLVVLATLATVIASQAVISGAFSVSRQAVRLGYLPALTVRHTSQQESGQIYVPAVNWLLYGGVVVLIVVFGSSERLATAYGLAVTGTLLLTTTLLLVYAATAWRWPWWRIALTAVVFGGLELLFFAANLTKIAHGGWLPILVAVVVVTVMTTWQRGRRIVTARRRDLEGSLAEFVDEMRDHEVPRVAGVAVFPHPTSETAPLALRANVRFNRVLHERVVIVSVLTEQVPHVPAGQRVSVDQLGPQDDGIVHVSARFGFQDSQDIPAVLQEARGLSDELDFEPAEASYFLSRMTIERGTQPGLRSWRKRLFIGLAHNAATPAGYFKLPVDRTVVMGSRVEL
ncbi:potassium transporter Kup [Pseudonocardia oroxyli]|uniref:Probable potassium transport system protein Kup n=1 Tax=Pseudonocardia oroxyli TaxID=366584 RepID=A0A1G7XUL2_PSEOR|nr:potassium transporter Kup [Pseudonocardia oroxyli]SDG87849.1 KUP system potassium uptake protein [Pseudonocardia oroxyli]